MRNLDVWYARAEVDTLARESHRRLGAKMRRRLQRRVDKTLRRDSAQAFAKLATEVDGQRPDRRRSRPWSSPRASS